MSLSRPSSPQPRRGLHGRRQQLPQRPGNCSHTALGIPLGRGLQGGGLEPGHVPRSGLCVGVPGRIPRQGRSFASRLPFYTREAFRFQRWAKRRAVALGGPAAWYALLSAITLTVVGSFCLCGCCMACLAHSLAEQAPLGGAAGEPLENQIPFPPANDQIAQGPAAAVDDQEKKEQ